MENCKQECYSCKDSIKARYIIQKVYDFCKNPEISDLKTVFDNFNDALCNSISLDDLLKKLKITPESLTNADELNLLDKLFTENASIVVGTYFFKKAKIKFDEMYYQASHPNYPVLDNTIMNSYPVIESNIEVKPVNPKVKLELEKRAKK